MVDIKVLESMFPGIEDRNEITESDMKRIKQIVLHSSKLPDGWVTEDALYRGLLLFRELARLVNDEHKAVGVCYGDFPAIINNFVSFDDFYGSPWRNVYAQFLVWQRDYNPNLADIITEANGGRIGVSRGQTQLNSAMDTFIWNNEKKDISAAPFEKGHTPYTRNQWEIVFPDHLRQVVRPNKTLKSKVAPHSAIHTQHLNSKKYEIPKRNHFVDCAPITAQQAQRTIIVAGCDVGVSDKDRNTGLVIVRYTPGEPLEILDHKRMSAEIAPKQVLSMVEKYNVDYLVMDAPLLPIYRNNPPESHKWSHNGEQRYFRPHEDMIRPGTIDVLRKSMPEIDDSIIKSFHDLLNRMQPQPTWTKDGSAPFVKAAQQIREAVADQLPIITDFTAIAKKGTFEGFPKAFFIPFLSIYNNEFINELPLLLDKSVVKEGTVDSAILKMILGEEHKSVFWQRDGIKLSVERNIDNEEVFDNKDIICAFSMALQGILYATGRAMALTSRLRDDSFDFGHILIPSMDVFEPWAVSWLNNRLDRVANSHCQAECLCYRPSKGDDTKCQ